MTVRVAINGFGRIGRNILRAIAESGRTDIEVVAINDLGPVETNAHLLRYDSVHGRFPGKVTVEGDTIDVGTGPIKVTAIRNPAELPHRDLGVDIAMECTGIFTAKDKAMAHVQAGAKRVLISAPGDKADLTVVYGVNHDKLTKDHIVVSNASCTTNCLAPVAMVLHRAVGIEKGFMTTIHSYTGDQPTLDTMHKDLYRARAAALSMIPTTTGAAKAVGPGSARARRQARRLVDPRADPERLGHRPQVPGRRATPTRPRSRRSIKAAAAAQELKGVLTYTEDAERLHPTSTTILIRRSSRWTRSRSPKATWYASSPGTTTSGAFPRRMADTAVAMGKLHLMATAVREASVPSAGSTMSMSRASASWCGVDLNVPMANGKSSRT